VSALSRIVRRRTFVFALGLTVVLLVANVIALPAFGKPSTWASTLTLFAPFAILAMASTPAVLSGGGGLDLSIGPLANLINIILVLHFLGTSVGSPWIAIPLVLIIGAAIGVFNGVAIAVLRYPPVIATLCVYFIIGGVNMILVAAPVTAPTSWPATLAGSIGPIPGAVFTIGPPLLLWIAIRRTPFYDMLLAVGGNDAAAYSAAVDVTRVRIIAYGLGGLIAAVGGIALTALTQSADSTLGPSYTLVALAAVVFGGSPLGGGRGGLLGSIFGAASIYLMQNLLSALNVSSLWIQVLYGGMLLIGAIFGSRVARPLPAAAAV